MGMENLSNLYADIHSKIKAPGQEWKSADLIEQIAPENILVYVPKWPLIVHILSALFCLGASAAFHLFQVLSVKTSNFLITLDYGGICILIMGSSIPFIQYVFAC